MTVAFKNKHDFNRMAKVVNRVEDEGRGGNVSSSRRDNLAVGSGTGGNGCCAYPCKITGTGNASGFPVDVYKNGVNNAKTGTGTITVLQLRIASRIPSGTWLMGYDTTLIAYNDEE